MRIAPWVGFVLLAVGVASLAWRASDAAAVPAPDARSFKWEYRAIPEADLINLSDEKTLEAGLNKLGNDGWELVAVRPTYYAAAVAKQDKVGVVYFLKRLKQGK